MSALDRSLTDHVQIRGMFEILNFLLRAFRSGLDRREHRAAGSGSGGRRAASARNFLLQSRFLCPRSFRSDRSHA